MHGACYLSVFWLKPFSSCCDLLLSQHHTYDLFSLLCVSDCCSCFASIWKVFILSMTWVFAQLARACQGCASTVPGVWALGFVCVCEVGGLKGGDGGCWGDVATRPILCTPQPSSPAPVAQLCLAERGLADLWEPINASPNAGKEERLSCNPYWLPCALSANLYHGFVPLNDVLLSSSPTLIHNIISFQYSPNYSSSDLNGDRINEKNSKNKPHVYTNKPATIGLI